MTTRTKNRRAFSVSIYCRHKESVLLIQHAELWQPIIGKIRRGETPLEAARRELHGETGFEQAVFPAIHKVLGAPPGLLLYEEHRVGDDTYMNFAFVAEVPSKRVVPSSEFEGLVWISSMAKVPENCPQNVRQALIYALSAGREVIVPSTT